MFRKVIGWLLVIYGTLTFFDVGPLLPGAGPGAFALGAVIAISGALTLGAGGAITKRIKALVSSSSSAPPKPADPMLVVRVLKLARASSGRLTASEVAITMEVPLDDAELALDELVRKGNAVAEVDLQTGVQTFVFPEFKPAELPEA